MSLLTPDNLRVMLIAPDLSTDKIEPLYNTPYAITPLSEDSKRRWAFSEPLASLQLPQPNPFIASEIQVKPKGDGGQIPALLVDNDGVQLWHLQDPSFAVPRSRIFVALHAQAANQDSRTQCGNVMK